MGNCFDQLLAWVRAGVLLEHFKTEPMVVIACIAECVSQLLNKITDHNHDDGFGADEDVQKALEIASGLGYSNGHEGIISSALLKMLAQQFIQALIELIANSQE